MHKSSHCAQFAQVRDILLHAASSLEHYELANQTGSDAHLLYCTWFADTIQRTRQSALDTTQSLLQAPRVQNTVVRLARRHPGGDQYVPAPSKHVFAAIIMQTPERPLAT